MEFEPKEPPGHASRKLLLHLAEVRRLRGQGYTIRQIRQAFCDAGVVIGWGTVQREVARLTNLPARTIASTPQTEQAVPQPQAKHVPPALPGAKRVNVAEFFASAVDNPLITRKQGPKP